MAVDDIAALVSEMHRQRAREKIEALEVAVVARADKKNHTARRIINQWRTAANRGVRTQRRRLTKEEWIVRNRSLGIDMVGYDNG